jgi:hypothetical protein
MSPLSHCVSIIGQDFLVPVKNSRKLMSSVDNLLYFPSLPLASPLLFKVD